MSGLTPETPDRDACPLCGGRKRIAGLRCRWCGGSGIAPREPVLLYAEARRRMILAGAILRDPSAEITTRRVAAIRLVETLIADDAPDEALTAVLAVLVTVARGLGLGDQP